MPTVKLPITPLKYVVGIDMAKDSFVACLGYLEVSQQFQQLHFGKEATFANTAAGFADLLQWVAKHQAAASPRWFVVEATGVYYEELAYFLADNHQLLSVLLPNKVKHLRSSILPVVPSLKDTVIEGLPIGPLFFTFGSPKESLRVHPV